MGDVLSKCALDPRVTLDPNAPGVPGVATGTTGRRKVLVVRERADHVSALDRPSPVGEGGVRRCRCPFPCSIEGFNKCSDRLVR